MRTRHSPRPPHRASPQADIRANRRSNPTNPSATSGKTASAAPTAHNTLDHPRVASNANSPSSQADFADEDRRRPRGTRTRDPRSRSRPGKSPASASIDRRGAAAWRRGCNPMPASSILSVEHGHAEIYFANDNAFKYACVIDSCVNVRSNAAPRAHPAARRNASFASSGRERSPACRADHAG